MNTVFPKAQSIVPEFHTRKDEKVLQRCPLHSISHNLAQTELQHAGWLGSPCLLIL